MSIQNLAPPTPTGQAELDRWLFLLWKRGQNTSPTSGDTILASTVFQHHPIQPVPIELAAVNQQSILAGQIFGA